ncbi:hypothetical protein [Streptomyces sp. NPDC003710]
MSDDPGSSPEPQAEKRPRQWQDVTVLVSVIGLLLSIVGAFLQVRGFQDQLQQSNEEAQQRSRAQAARISIWVDERQDGEPQVHLTNRSPDPVSNVDFQFSSSASGNTFWRVYLVGLAPCSDTTFAWSQLWFRVGGSRSYRVKLKWVPPQVSKPSRQLWKPAPSPEMAGWYLAPDAVIFTDRDGEEWVRNRGGKLKKLDFVPTEDILPAGLVVGQPHRAKADPCDEPVQ